MSDQNDNWSDKKWEDARKYDGSQNQNRGFGFGFSSQMRQYGSDYNSKEEGFMGNSILRGNSGKIGSGWMRSKNSNWVIIIVLLIVLVYTFYSQAAINRDITKSTIERTKITSTLEFNSDNAVIFEDEAGVVDSDSTFRSAAGTFYDKTGVVPFVKFVSTETTYDDSELTKMAEAYNEENFKDGEHFVIFFQPNDEGAAGYAVGEKAEAVLDSEAVQIFDDYLMKFYKERQNNNQGYMVNAINYSASRIMTTAEYSSSTIILGVIVVCVLIFVIAYSVMKRKKEVEQLKEENPAIETDDNTISRRANGK